MKQAVILLIVFIVLGKATFAQQKQEALPVKGDSTVSVAKNDSLNAGKKATAKTDSVVFMTPKKIAMFSAIVPGLGQIKNKQYWKLPIIYGGLGVATYFIIDNKKNYNACRSEYAARLSTGKTYVDPEFQYADAAALQRGIDYYKQNLDLTYLLTGIGYALQIVDAVVFAHLKGFDISEDITLHYKPVALPNGTLGFGLVMNF